MAKDIAQKNEAGQPPYNICERTFQLALRVVRLCVRFDAKWGTAGVLAKQLLRSGSSVGANIEEGQAEQILHPSIPSPGKRLAKPIIGCV